MDTKPKDAVWPAVKRLPAANTLQLAAFTRGNWMVVVRDVWTAIYLAGWPSSRSAILMITLITLGATAEPVSAAASCPWGDCSADYQCGNTPGNPDSWSPYCYAVVTDENEYRIAVSHDTTIGTTTFANPSSLQTWYDTDGDDIPDLYDFIDGEGGLYEETTDVAEEILSAIDSGQTTILSILTLTMGCILSASAAFAIAGLLRRFVWQAGRRNRW